MTAIYQTYALKKRYYNKYFYYIYFIIGKWNLQRVHKISRSRILRNTGKFDLLNKFIIFKRYKNRLDLSIFSSSRYFVKNYLCLFIQKAFTKLVGLIYFSELKTSNIIFFMLFLSDFDCNSSYVYEGETANIGCNLNTTSFFSINVTRLNSTIASILADGSVIVHSEYQGKLTAILSLASLRLSITLSSVTCSDSDTYTSKMYLRSGDVPFTTFKVIMKG